MAETQDLLYIRVQENFNIVQGISASISTDNVTIEIRRLSDNFTFDFAARAFRSGTFSGTMAFIAGILWRQNFTPPTEDTYAVTINNVTRGRLFTQILVARGGIGALTFSSQSEVSIANLALTSLGADRIMALDEATENARRVMAIYPHTRDDVLRAHPWNFAIRRASLARLVETPAFDYAFAYQLPTDCLRVIRINDLTGKIDYEIAQGRLLTNEPTVMIKYISRVENPAMFDSNFIGVLASRLAAELALTITGSQVISRARWEEYFLKLREVRSIDAQESKAEVVQHYSWLEGRD